MLFLTFPSSHDALTCCSIIVKYWWCCLLNDSANIPVLQNLVHFHQSLLYILYSYMVLILPALIYYSPWNENLNLLIQSNSLIYYIYIYIYIYLNKNWKMYWFEQSFTGLGLEDRCSWWGLISITITNVISHKGRWSSSCDMP